MTNLYNRRPQWLVDAHSDLDAAIAAAYGWPANIAEEEALANLLELNLSREALNAGAKPGLKAKLPRRSTPEELRRAPQMKLPIAGSRTPVVDSQKLDFEQRDSRSTSSKRTRNTKSRAS
ncbi:hypothetical protein [Rhizobium sp. SYY.PMSO]|uniref:hypothetical protein n=1 Tax=Rhizobium sp. SYY.PMSO TaxID=3382192 RepID=UPI000DE4AED2